MKVLFAVHDEKVSLSIVKKYQREYKEIISYKNVYYYNAILKELQRDKSYDRVVIDEELEEFTSSSYEEKDKFIFNKLDSITDEASGAKGKDIPIILICSERRTKGDDTLVKLFGIGIYNAIIGKDRSTDEVCRLINKPRIKKEAKAYYRIDSSNVDYEPESENDVSEEEMQHILAYYKKIGKNELKCVEAFRKLSTQYNNEQIKIIMKILPTGTKAILEESSPEYQKYVTMFGGKIQKREAKRNEPSTSIELIDTKSKENDQPIVIPSNINKTLIKKLTIKKPAIPTIDEIEDEDEDEVKEVEEVQEAKPKRRGRPPKNSKPAETTKTRKRGRPAKKIVEDIEEEQKENAEILPGFEKKEDNKKTTTLPGFSDEEDDDNKKTTTLPGFSDEEDEEDDEEFKPINNDLLNPRLNNSDEDVFLGFEDDSEEDDDDDKFLFANNRNVNNNYEDSSSNNNMPDDYKKDYSDYDFSLYNSLLTSNKKVIAFVGTSKNGTSFIINNIAKILSDDGIDTAILDATKNKNSYYVYNNNDDELRTAAANSITNLIDGNPGGMKISQNLSIYVEVPDQMETRMGEVGPILENIVREHSVILIDCDFNTPLEYFANAQEIYLVQSMDVLTIQPLTAFLKKLKNRNILEQNKIRIIINKFMRLKGITSKQIVGGMSNYNNPEMSIMTELFDRNLIVPIEIPFELDVYARYLEGLAECNILVNKYPKDFQIVLNKLSAIIYPLLPANKSKAKPKKGYQYPATEYANGFSKNVNNTLNNMKKNL